MPNLAHFSRSGWRSVRALASLLLVALVGVAFAAGFGAFGSGSGGSGGGVTIVNGEGEAMAAAPASETAATAEPTGRFEVRDGKIFDPSGREFLIKGANVSGRNFGWSDTDTLTYANNISNDWKFNLVRVNECVKGVPACQAATPPSWCKPYWGRGATPEEHDALVNAFTSRGVVVMFEAHDWSGSYPNGTDLQKLIGWQRGLAERYKDNPYVWFNVQNEPGFNCAPVDQRWLSIHDAVIAAIRDTGNENIVVADGSNFGIERDCGANANARPRTSLGAPCRRTTARS